METAVKVTAIIVAGILILGLAGGLAIWNLVKPENQVVVNGEANVNAMPDLITVYFNVETNGASAQVAKDNNSAVTDEVITNLVKAGLAREEISTQNYNIYEDIRWENSKQKSYGYKAAHYMKVELASEKASKIGEVIDAVIDGGAMLNYINFELSKTRENDYKAEALRLASEDARIKAEAMASGLGKRVVEVLSISESNFYYNPWRVFGQEDMVYGAAEAKAATTNIQPGEQKISGRVSVSFKIA